MNYFLWFIVLYSCTHIMHSVLKYAWYWVESMSQCCNCMKERFFSSFFFFLFLIVLYTKKIPFFLYKLKNLKRIINILVQSVYTFIVAAVLAVQPAIDDYILYLCVFYLYFFFVLGYCKNDFSKSIIFIFTDSESLNLLIEKPLKI